MSEQTPNNTAECPHCGDKYKVTNGRIMSDLDWHAMRAHGVYPR